jgi:hypothetical protein
MGRDFRMAEETPQVDAKRILPSIASVDMSVLFHSDAMDLLGERYAT